MNRYVVGIQKGAYKQEFSHHFTVVICTAAVAAKKGKVFEMARDLKRTVERVYVFKDVMDENGDYAYTLDGNAVPSEYDLTGGEMCDLLGGVYAILRNPDAKTQDLIGCLLEDFQNLFLYGYVLGHRATVAGKYRELKKKDIEKIDYRHEKERA